jgi:hypothetical protein
MQKFHHLLPLSPILAANTKITFPLMSVERAKKKLIQFMGFTAELMIYQKQVGRVNK